MAATASPARRAGRRPSTTGAVLVCILAALGLLVVGCGSGEQAGAPLAMLPPQQPMRQITPAPNVTGDPAEGRRLFVSTGCAGCHTVQDVPAASGIAGPNLTNVVLRPTLAGDTIPMTPESLVAFLLDPPAVKPGTTMPNVGLTPEQAQHLTAFLYSQPENPSR